MDSQQAEVNVYTSNTDSQNKSSSPSKVSVNSPMSSEVTQDNSSVRQSIRRTFHAASTRRAKSTRHAWKRRSNPDPISTRRPRGAPYHVPYARGAHAARQFHAPYPRGCVTRAPFARGAPIPRAISTRVRHLSAFSTRRTISRALGTHAPTK